MRLLAVIGALAIAAIVAGGVFFFGGFYDVSAVNGGDQAVEWAVRNVREASVHRQAKAPPQPAWFGKPETVKAGAQEFAEEGCANCHGAPGVKPEKFARGMDPDPPDLGRVGRKADPAAIFWVVKHGIRMTGMPGFGDHVKDEDIWKLTAFVKQMSGTSPATFKQWTSGESKASS